MVIHPIIELYLQSEYNNYPIKGKHIHVHYDHRKQIQHVIIVEINKPYLATVDTLRIFTISIACTYEYIIIIIMMQETGTCISYVSIKVKKKVELFQLS